MTTDPDKAKTWQIEELLHRRTDLSTFVIHWTRDCDGSTANDNLLSILKAGLIEARRPMGAAVYTIEEMFNEGKIDQVTKEAALSTQRVVCFTEAPLEQAWSFVVSIEGRQHDLQPFGLAFTKKRAREMGINPIWYMDMTPGHNWLTQHVEALVADALSKGGDFAQHPIANIAAFMEGMGTWDKSRKEFWWEREWRHVGKRTFSLENVAVVLCPEERMQYFQPLLQTPSGRIVPAIDPRWGLEHIIMNLAGVPEP